MTALLVLATLQAGDSYSSLAAGIRAEEWLAVEQAHEGKSATAPFLVPNMSPLKVERAAADHWVSILLGLRKLSDLPYTPGPVNENVLSLGKLATMAARAKFSSGERHGGVTLLLDGLTMASRIRPAAAPLAAGCDSLVMKTFAQSLDAIPLFECDRVRTALVPLLAEPGLSVKRQSCLSLLRLHMRVEAYRWRFLKVPARLADAAPAAEIEDPATKRPFKFEITTSGYRLLSEEYDSLGAE